MPIEVRAEQGHLVVGVSGRLTLGTEVESLEAAVTEQLRLGHRKFVFDMAHVEYVDSSGIGAIVSCLTKVKQEGGELRVAGANPRLQRMFKMTGVDSLLSIYPDVTGATAG